MIKDTVFSPSFGNRPSYLVGREEILASFMRGIESAPGSRERATLLLGQRGSGKTVLLWELADRAATQGFVVASPTIVSEDMLTRIVEKLQDAGERVMQNHSAKITGGTVGAFGFSVGLEFSREIEETKSAEYKLTQLVRRLTKEGYGTLILVDELQANSTEVRKLVSVYQELVGEQLNIALAMAGLPAAVSATLNDHVLTFLNRAHKVELTPLALSDVEAFYQNSFEQLGIKIEPETIKQAAEFTQGSPYLLQLVGHSLVLRASDTGEITDTAIQDAFDAAQADFEIDICQTTLAALSEKDIEFLQAMSLDEEASRVADIAERMGVTIDYAQKYRKRLIDSGKITPSRRGFVRYAIPYLKDYLRTECQKEVTWL